MSKGMLTLLEILAGAAILVFIFLAFKEEIPGFITTIFTFMKTKLGI